MASLQDLGNIPMTGAGVAARRCRALATVTREVGTQVSSHYNVTPVIDIYGAVQGRDLGSVAREINPILGARRRRTCRAARRSSCAARSRR